MGDLIEWRRGARRGGRFWRIPRFGHIGALWLVLAGGFIALGATGLSRTLAPEWKPNVIRLPTSKTKDPGASLVGRASVVDGDTIKLQGESVRLNGIDAPESRQTCEDSRGARYACGRVSANALDQFLAQSRPTRCEFVSRDRYGRFVGACFRADGADVSAWLVRNGQAIEWLRYSGGRYSREQDAARASKAGVWQGRFEMPWDWRAARH